MKALNLLRTTATDRTLPDIHFSDLLRTAGLSVALLLFLPGCVSHQPSGRSTTESAAAKTAAAPVLKNVDNQAGTPVVAGAATNSNRSPDSGWQSLFDGKSLNGWKVTEFGGHGEVATEDAQIVIHAGAMLTGVSWTNQFPKTGYEVEIEARKVEGGDFFCGITFPVGDTFCSFIAGGWGGGVVGLSSIDGMDASENETTKYMSFPKDHWYRFKLRVTRDKIEAWIDEEQMVDQSIVGRRITLRSGDIYLAQPFGISTWQTTGAVRSIRIRPLTAAPAGSAR